MNDPSGWLILDDHSPWPSGEPIQRAEVLLLSARPSRQEAFLEQLAPSLRSGQTVVFIAGKLASLEFQERAAALGVATAETSSALEHQEHRPVWLGSPTSSVAEKAVGLLSSSFPNLTQTRSPEECSLNDPAGIIFPATLLLNLSRIEQMGPYRTAYCDTTESVGRVLDALDRERMAIGRALAWEVHPLATLLGAKPGPSFQAVRSLSTWRSHMSPDSVNHPHFLEEIPFHLAPLVELAMERDVPVPLLRSVQLLAEAATGRNLRAKRSFLRTVHLTREDSDDPEFGHSGLQEVVTSREEPRSVALPGSPPTIDSGSVQVVPSGDIAESFERLRLALEKKLSQE